VTTRDALGGVVLLLFGLVTVILSLRLPVGTFRAAGSGLFPLCLGLLLMLLSGIHLLRLRRSPVPASPHDPNSPRLERGRMACFLAAVAVATFLLTPLGYLCTAFLLMVALLRTLEFRRWSATLAIALLTAVGSHLLFVRWLQIPLPRGWIGL
jgi:hypothetical protein